MLSVSSMPIFANSLPTMPMLYGMTYIVRPCMEPLKMSPAILYASFGSIQLLMGTGVVLAAAADEGAVLHARHVVDGGAVQVALGEQVLVEFDEFARGARLGAERVALLLAAVDEHDPVGVAQRRAFVDKAKHFFVFDDFCHIHTLALLSRAKHAPPAFSFPTIIPENEANVNFLGRLFL